MEVTCDGINYDGVTAALTVNESVHVPLLCVVDVFGVPSGDLSLAGMIEHQANRALAV